MKRQHDSSLTLSVDTSRAESVNLDKQAIGARMKAARNSLGMTQDQLATIAGSTSKRGIQDNEAGNAMPGGQMIGALIHAGINANWLLTGEGPMLLEELPRQGGADLEAARAEIADLHARMDKLMEERAPQMEVMREVVMMLEEELEEADIDLTPDSKAKVIVILYEYAVKAGALDAPMLRSVLSLAA